jgi:hypothetical protein
MKLKTLLLWACPLLLSGCMTKNSNSCVQQCVNRSTGYGELKACEARCGNPNAIVDERSKYTDRTARN